MYVPTVPILPTLFQLGGLNLGLLCGTTVDARLGHYDLFLALFLMADLSCSYSTGGCRIEANVVSQKRLVGDKINILGIVVPIK